MSALKAKVINGRYVIEEAADLPEGTEIYLVATDDAGQSDGLSEDERQAIRTQIAVSIEQRRAGGPLFDAAEVIGKLGSR